MPIIDETDNGDPLVPLNTDVVPKRMTAVALKDRSDQGLVPQVTIGPTKLALIEMLLSYEAPGSE